MDHLYYLYALLALALLFGIAKFIFWTVAIICKRSGPKFTWKEMKKTLFPKRRSIRFEYTEERNGNGNGNHSSETATEKVACDTPKEVVTVPLKKETTDTKENSMKLMEKILGKKEEKKETQMTDKPQTSSDEQAQGLQNLAGIEQIGSMMLELKELKAEHEKLQTDKANAEQASKLASAAQETLMKQLEEEKSKKERALKGESDLKEQVSQLEGKIEGMKSGAEGAVKTRESLEARIKKLESENSGLKTKLGDEIAARDTAEKRLQELEPAFDTTVKRLKELKKGLAAYTHAQTMFRLLCENMQPTDECDGGEDPDQNLYALLRKEKKQEVPPRMNEHNL